jgi:hypothetical protein
MCNTSNNATSVGLCISDNSLVVFNFIGNISNIYYFYHGDIFESKMAGLRHHYVVVMFVCMYVCEKVKLSL